jgi:ABC-type oligopeptide transport system ATPase subunit
MTAPLVTGRAIRRVYPLPRTSLFGSRAERVALDAVDVTIPEGGSLGIVGESGSGKSTLVRILLGLDRATSGTVTYRDQPITPGRPRPMRWFRREAQIVLQDPLSSLDPRASTRCSMPSASTPRGAVATRTSSRVVSSNASPSPAPSPLARSCWWATNR